MSVLSPPAAPSEPTPSGEDRSDTGRVLLALACGPALAGYALVAAVLGLVISTAPGADIAVTGTARAAAAGWLAAHRVPLVVHGAPLGALPLLPTLLLGSLVAVSCGRVARRRGLDRPADAARIAGVVAALHAVFGTWVAVVGLSSGVSAAPVQAALGCGVVAGLAAVCGLVQPCRLVSALPGPAWTPHALAGAAAGSAVLLAGGLMAVLAGLLVSATAVGELFGAWGPGAGPAIGLLLLSVAYLPNAAIAAASWSVGTGVSIGAASVTPFDVVAGPVPAVPLLAALPEGPTAPWWVVAFALPVAAGAMAGRRCGLAGDEPAVRVRAAAAAAGIVAVTCFVLAVLAGGRLGAGAVDPVRVPAGSFAVAAAVWTFLPAACVAWLSGSRGGHDATAEPDDTEPTDGAEPPP